MHYLLVQPKYYSRYPPLGLLKISTYLKNQGHTVEFIKGQTEPKKTPDEIYVTSLFTYAWKIVHETIESYKALFPNVKITLGGLYASLMPDHAKTSMADEIFEDLFKEAENLIPDYSLVPIWNGSLIFSSRGCIRKCGYCAVPILEPEFKANNTIINYIHEKHSKVILWDNNILASPYIHKILDELLDYIKEKDFIGNWVDQDHREIFKEMNLPFRSHFLKVLKDSFNQKFEVDFNHGLDARLITLEIARKLKQLNVKYVRLAYDRTDYREEVKNAIDILKQAGYRGRDLFFYTLYNFNDTPEGFFLRHQDLMRWGVASYPMRYIPLRALNKNSFISKNWTAEDLEMIADARRVIGVRGAFPPYKGLQLKILNAKSFTEAFKLRPPKNVKIQTRAKI